MPAWLVSLLQGLGVCWGTLILVCVIVLVAGIVIAYRAMTHRGINPPKF